jgi:hypothetical protein
MLHLLGQPDSLRAKGYTPPFAVIPHPDGPGHLGAFNRPYRFPMEVRFVRVFCMVAQGT